MLAQVLASRPTAEARIADQAAGSAFGVSRPWPVARPLLQQGHPQRSLMALARRQAPGNGLAGALSAPLDRGPAAPLTAAEGCCLWPPCLTPAACWWARMRVLSTQWSRQLSRPSASPCGWRVSKSFCRRPARFQREKRRATVGQGPSHAGSSRQGARATRCH
jgi:hypothetical protein